MIPDDVRIAEILVKEEGRVGCLECQGMACKKILSDDEILDLIQNGNCSDFEESQEYGDFCSNLLEEQDRDSSEEELDRIAVRCHVPEPSADLQPSPPSADLHPSAPSADLQPSASSIGLQSSPEMAKFIGINMLMSCIPLPQVRMYWSKKYRIPLIANHMSRNRYLQIRRFLKVVDDNSIPATVKKADVAWKVRPLLDSFRNGALQLIRPHSLCIDEQMIPFQAVTNAWVLYKKDGNSNVSLLDFKINIAESLILSGSTNSSDSNSESTESSDENEIPNHDANGRRNNIPALSERTRGARHMPSYFAAPFAQRCRYPSCNGRGRVMCVACNVVLCFTPNKNCFKNFHSPN
ncbi:hypothetical protein M8J76_015847 [Diaphorina citri]|nr:hypothetical protein M8J76_015847 [Diaphorina citri]